MKQYTFSFSGEITIEAETEDEARAMSYGSITNSPYLEDNCVDCSIHSIKLNKESEDI